MVRGSLPIQEFGYRLVQCVTKYNKAIDDFVRRSASTGFSQVLYAIAKGHEYAEGFAR